MFTKAICSLFLLFFAGAPASAQEIAASASDSPTEELGVLFEGEESAPEKSTSGPGS